ncbi:leucyl/phenylalanyl-tRNA--protein transferase [Psychrosphaera sp. 1_MG-2023]|uniref:leucyl/phenylalanyl-tRNA--protein transferase n=1 Tax=unclassified Psychrosphaera TaxID=2641570 RepID=UPI0026E48317|nr:leucyl/phenylalanyl-tRNA--protein transferase [Psychrosphaera sp. 1_MG-2023]MDO6720086.1 leucyl/phenylalanyl-tRNA--protein transferase [Psychrosphaera sp. 1_MG-2023]
MTQTIHYLTDETSWFPDPNQAMTDPPGLLAIGGDLQPDRIYSGYQQGIFPWFNDGEPVMWWSPDPRNIINVDAININKSLKKFLRKCDYHVTINNQFESVITACAKPRSNGDGTWILPKMIKAYNVLHQQGRAHSIEIWQWQNDKKVLVGGLYGINVGSCFCGESMFSAQPNASKLALIVLGKLLRNEKHAFIDCQLPNPYLSQMGAFLVSRSLFLGKLALCKNETICQSVFKPRAIDWRTELI